MKHAFEGKLIGRGPGKAWTFLPIPAAIARAFETKARVPVSGTINGFPFRSSLLPEGDGTHAMAVNKEMLKGAQAKAGQRVSVTLELDTATRTVALPEDMDGVLSRSKGQKAIFEGLSYSKQKEFVDWIEQAKRSETRARRLQAMLALLAEGRSPKG